MYKALKDGDRYTIIHNYYEERTLITYNNNFMLN